MNGIMYVGVANLATRAAKPPLPVRWELGLAGRLIGDPYGALQNLGRLQNRTRHVGVANLATRAATFASRSERN